MDAASTASAPPAVSPSYRWSSVPTPPEAITGIPTRSAMVRVNRMSYPSRVPSRSMRVGRRGRVDRYLVGPGGKQVPDVFDRPDAAPDRKRHEHLLGGAAHHIHEDVAFLVGCGGVEKGGFAGRLLVRASGPPPAP